ncbi:sodium/nucleoside cotransporter [Elysia marginata]|uniref:Sodium/nucleoside cotransporter n=1 Tax=Elysia marginata TaxID=1093978 RepID=A0AAV4JNP2_9GAST|nr:sodium/nucleoside cotransporter [Elysia marginata]
MAAPVSKIAIDPRTGPRHSSDDSDVGVHLTDISATDKDELDSEDESVGEESSSSLLTEIVSRISGDKLKYGIVGVVAFLYAAYFICAVVMYASASCDERHDVMPLVALTIVVGVGILYWLLTSRFSEPIDTASTLASDFITSHWSIIKWVLLTILFGGILAIIITSIVQKPSNTMSLVGWLFLVLLLMVCSRAPRKINWRPVLGGFALQFYFAAMILKWDKGYDLFDAIGKLFTKFMAYSSYGADFVFGNTSDHFFAFKILPVIIFFSCVITMLYYVGVMQALIEKIATVMRVTLGTTAAESLCAAANIFIGLIEAPMLVRPFLRFMTRSELHAVMVGGYSTIAGGVLAAYIMKGVSAIHLLTASAMSAPTALAVSKILYPELGRSRPDRLRETINEKP